MWQASTILTLPTPLALVSWSQTLFKALQFQVHLTIGHHYSHLYSFTFRFLRPRYCSIPCQTLDWKLNSLWVRDKCFYSDALFENKRPMMVSYLDSRIWSNIFNISKYTIFNSENYWHFFEKFVICIKRIINVPHYKNRILRMRLSSLNIYYT